MFFALITVSQIYSCLFYLKSHKIIDSFIMKPPTVPGGLCVLGYFLECVCSFEYIFLPFLY